MELDKNNVKKILGIVAFGVLLYALCQKWDSVTGLFGQLFGYIFPFVLGACIAFILNVPMRFIETRVLAKLITNQKSLLYKMRRAISVVLTLVLVISVLFMVTFLVVPALGSTFSTVASQLPGALADLQEWGENLAYKLMDEYPDVAKQILSVQIDWEQLGSQVAGWLRTTGSNVVSSTIGVATSVVGSLVNFFLAAIFSIYVLLQKEKLGKQCKQLLYAFFPEALAGRVLYISAMAEQTFSRFLSGQCLEAMILGALFFVAMSVLGFKYAVMISVLIAVMALIPIFGAFIGLGVGSFLLVIDDPMRAFWFVVLFFALQQIEGNFIYPYVVGNSVGLPSIWVLVAVTVGGSAFGVAGMLLFIPLCSVLYALARESVYGRLQRRYGGRHRQLTTMQAGKSQSRKKKAANGPPQAGQ